MFLWFAGLSFVLVWTVFRSPVVDYRMVMVGSVLPVLNIAFGGTPILHTVLAPVVAFGAVVAATVGRRLLRRRLLAIPIGWFLHLVLDGTWSDAGGFWWPLFGVDAGRVPEAGRSLPVLLAMELIGAVALVWTWRRFGLSDRRRWEEFVGEGRLDASVRPPAGER